MTRQSPTLPDSRPPRGELVEPSTLDSLDQVLSDLHLHPFFILAIEEANLSPRESLVLSLSLQGFTTREIGSQLHLSHTHIIRILRKISRKVVPKLPSTPIFI